MAEQKKTTARNLVEVFGYAPTDTTPTARKFWQLNACPFVGKSCTKYDHTKTICYGTCSVSNNDQDVIICPHRLYEDDYKTIRKVANDVFGRKTFMLFDEYLKAAQKNEKIEAVVALGQKSGKEVKITKMSMDWVLAHIKNGELLSYVGIEVQSIDITGNYRDAWYAARDKKTHLPPSGHGLNWANVHKRLIPQIIRKALVYRKSALVKSGIHFIVPEPVYQRFEEIIGADIPTVKKSSRDVVTVHTYQLGSPVAKGKRRNLILNRVIRFELEEFSSRFISGPNLPSGESLDEKIKEILGVKK